MDEVAVEVLPFHQKDLIPKDRLDRGLFVFMSTVIPALALWEATIVYHYHPTLDLVAFFHLISEIFILTNVLGNLYYLKRVDASGKQKSLPAVLRPGWRYCHFCQLNSPPRAYHCPVCDECVLKRDHHCMFAGCCVGFHNQRYFLLAVIYIWIGAAYAFIYQWDYCFEMIGGIQMSSFLSLAAPHIAFLFGFLSLLGFIVTVTQVLLLIATGLTLYLIIQQLICISNGQTVHERKEGIATYDLGWKRNFIQVLGEQWYLALVFPFSFSNVPGDGLYFQTYRDLEEIKDI